MVSLIKLIIFLPSSVLLLKRKRSFLKQLQIEFDLLSHGCELTFILTPDQPQQKAVNGLFCLLQLFMGLL